MHGCALEEAISASSPVRAILQLGIYGGELLTALFQPVVAISANTRRYNPWIRHVIPNGIDLSRFRPDPGRRDPRPSILFVGALGGRKRGRRMLSLFDREIRPAIRDAELHMVTEPGPPLSRVTYHTGIDREELIRLYQRAWLVVSLSTYEGFGLPYVEAMACGTPVVATSNPGSREVLENGRFGRLASDENIPHQIIDLLRDASARAALSDAGLERAAAFDIDNTSRAYEQLLQEVVG
jgi:glycosyltransferase involved in cell wall biosynthesis